MDLEMIFFLSTWAVMALVVANIYLKYQAAKGNIYELKSVEKELSATREELASVRKECENLHGELKSKHESLIRTMDELRFTESERRKAAMRLEGAVRHLNGESPIH